MRAAVSFTLALLVAGTLCVASSATAEPTTPIQSRILKSRTRKKPQLTSSPLPDSTGAKTSPGG